MQYRGAVGNFHNRNFFNTKAVNKVFGHRYWMPTNFGTVLLLLIITVTANNFTNNNCVLYYTKVAKLQKASVSVYFFLISS